MYIATMLEALIKGIALGFMLSISVGPVIFSIIKQSISNGYKGGITFILGVSVSDISLVVVSQLFTELFRQILTYRTPIGVGGSVMLIIMGIYVLFFKKSSANEDGQLSVVTMRKRDYAKIFASGFFMNILNPAVFAFWLIIATSVVSYDFSYRVSMFTAALAVVLVMDLLKVWGAAVIRKKLTPLAIHRINQLSGLILIGFGIALLWGTIWKMEG